MKKLSTMTLILLMSLGTLAVTHADYDDMDHEAHQETMEAHHQLIEEAVADQDFDAFVEEVEAHHEAIEEKKEAYCEEHEDDHDSDEDEHEHEREDKRMMKCDDDHDMEDVSEEEMTEKLQERFDHLVAYYQENGELPEMKEMHMQKNMKEMHGERKEMWKEHKEERKEMGDASTDEKKEMRMEYRKERKHFRGEHRTLVRKAFSSAGTEKLTMIKQKITAMLSTTDDERITDILEGIQEVIDEVLAE